MPSCLSSIDSEKACDTEALKAQFMMKLVSEISLQDEFEAPSHTISGAISFEADKRRLLAEKEALSKRRRYLTSSETLQKLTKPPYFSRESLTTSKFTTKVERKMVERVDRKVWVDEVNALSQQVVPQSNDSTSEENVRDRVYNPNDLNRNGSARTSRYRAKMEKARREFIANGSDPNGMKVQWTV
ncbi:unnamed protein product [Haemonchus placei]|uniref:SCHIP-1 domain-containing protein n=1 Tax=Haemonchus placei TaxID=6290 RepID=A0A0N4VS01_HAEPC|nr:unnamed protein product [Haemonchus placei]